VIISLDVDGISVHHLPKHDLLPDGNQDARTVLRVPVTLLSEAGVSEDVVEARLTPRQVLALRFHLLDALMVGQEEEDAAERERLAHVRRHQEQVARKRNAFVQRLDFERLLQLRQGLQKKLSDDQVP
jgi:hypothetical protein